MKSKMRTNKKFTLVELLCVVAVMAILLSLLINSLNTAVAEGYTGQCASDMRQTGALTHSYISDYNGYFPYIGNGVNSYTLNGVQYHQGYTTASGWATIDWTDTQVLLTMYNKNNWISLFTSDTQGTSNKTISDDGKSLCSNSQWPSFLKCPFISSDIAPGKAFNSRSSFERRLSAIKRPSGKIWSMDYAGSNSFDSGGGNYAIWFGQRSTAKNISWGGACPGGGQIMPEATWTNAKKNNDFLFGRHNSRVNVLMFDGSNQLMNSRIPAYDHYTATTANNASTRHSLEAVNNMFNGIGDP